MRMRGTESNDKKHHFYHYFTCFVKRQSFQRKTLFFRYEVKTLFSSPFQNVFGTFGRRATTSLYLKSEESLLQHP